MRLTDWTVRLETYIDRHRTMPFAWGAHDCVTWAAGAVEAVTGHRPAIAPYSDARSAARTLRGLGGLAAVTTAALGTPVAPTLAQRGDVALLEQTSGVPGLAVCVGHAWVAPGADGLVFGPMAGAVAAWRVG